MQYNEYFVYLQLRIKFPASTIMLKNAYNIPLNDYTNKDGYVCLPLEQKLKEIIM